MLRRRLVLIVGFLVGEDDVQGHVEIAIVDLAVQFRSENASPEENDARMRRQVLVARLHEPGTSGFTAVVQGEIDVVGQQCGHGASQREDGYGTVSRDDTQEELVCKRWSKGDSVS